MSLVQHQVNQKLLKIVDGINSGKDDETLILIDEALSAWPELGGLRFGRAIVAARLGRVEEAEKELSSLLQIANSPKDKIQYFLSNLNESKSSSEPAIEVPKLVVDAAGSAEVNRLVDSTLDLLKHGRSAEAMETIIKAKQKKVAVRDLDYARALCFMALKVPNYQGNARECLREELRHFPDNKLAKELLGSLLKEEGFENTAPLTGDQEFDELYQQIADYSMLPIQRLYTLYNLTKQVCQANIPGDFVECGVAGGGSTALIAMMIKRYSKVPRILYACDSYEGMPEPSEHDTVKGIEAEASGWGTGTCAAPENVVLEVCKKLDVVDHVEIVKGYFENTLPGLKDKMSTVGFMHVDCDWYESTKTVLEELYCKLKSGSVVQLDDYGYWEGVKKAVDEFSSVNKLNISPLDIDGGSAWFQVP